MAHVDTGGKGGKRSMDAALNLVPYIDLLVTLMTFLMITAAWASYSALTAQAAGGGTATDASAPKEPLVIDVLEKETRGLDALASATKDTPIKVRVEDGVHHGKVIEILDAIAEKKLGPATVEPMGS
jgi:biopolymer transport protein ExbD